MNLSEVKWRGIGSVVGSFLIQLMVGSWVATIGNMLPYFTSYMRWRGLEVTMGDMILVQAAGGIAMGLSQMMGGLIFIPYLGLKGCLYLSCCLFLSGSLLTFWSLDFGLVALVLTYGILPAAGMNMALVPTYLIPTKWFPSHRGIIIGIIQVGFGLSSTVFIPLQTFLTNPSNVAATSQDPLHYSFDGRPTISNSTVVPNLNNSSTGIKDVVMYFTDKDVLERIPWAVLYLAVIYGGVIVVALALVVGPPPQNSEENEKVERSSRVKEALKFLVKTAFVRADYYLLFLTQGFLLVVNAGLYGQWKALSLSVNSDDQMVALVGSMIGLFNCVSRFVGGFLIDRFAFRHVMSCSSLLLACICFSIVFVTRTGHFFGFAVVVWAAYLFAMAHFATVPAQAIKLFGTEKSSIIIGTCGFANALSYIIFAILNQFFFSEEVSANSFLWFFVTLGGFALMATVVAAFVSEPSDDKTDGEKNQELEEGKNISLRMRKKTE